METTIMGQDVMQYIITANELRATHFKNLNTITQCSDLKKMDISKERTGKSGGIVISKRCKNVVLNS